MENHELTLRSLSDRDLLARLIGIKAAKRLYGGRLTPLFHTDGDRVQERCAAARELVMRWLNEQMQSGDVLSSPASVKDYLRIYFSGQKYESFVTLFLDSQNRLIVAEELFRGTLTQTAVYPREVVKAALRVNAGAAIFAHNHPSGVAEPSKADELLTRNLKQALALVDVRVLDHIVVAGKTAVSLAERGVP